MAQIGVKINIVLIALNLLPLPPLDGGRIAVSLLPHRQAFHVVKNRALWHLHPDIHGVYPVLGWVLMPVMSILMHLLNLIV